MATLRSRPGEMLPPTVLTVYRVIRTTDSGTPASEARRRWMPVRIMPVFHVCRGETAPIVAPPQSNCKGNSTVLLNRPQYASRLVLFQRLLSELCATGVSPVLCRPVTNWHHWRNASGKRRVVRLRTDWIQIQRRSSKGLCRRPAQMGR